MNLKSKVPYAIIKKFRNFIFLISVIVGCNNAKALNLDASSSAIGALLSDGNIGLFGAGESSNIVSVKVAGYLNLPSKQMTLTLTNTTTDGAQELQITENGTHSFTNPLNPGSEYTVSLGVHTGGQNCSITGATGQVGVSSPAKIDCERTLAVVASRFSGSIPIVEIYPIDHKKSSVGATISLPTSAGVPHVDLVWTGQRYLVIWNSNISTLLGRLFDVELTPIGPSFQIGTGSEIRAVAAAYNSTNDEFGIVFSVFGNGGSPNTVNYMRLQPDGSLIGNSPTQVIAVGNNTGIRFGNSDIVWDGAKYIVAFEQFSTSDGVNNLVVESFTTGAANFINQFVLAKGTGSTGAVFPSGTNGLAFPNFLRTSTDTWLFFNRTNTNTNGSVIDSSLMEWRNFAGSPTQIKRDPNPSSCNPSVGFQFRVPSSANFGNKILISYSLACSDSASNFFDVYHTAINSINGSAGPSVNYSGSTIGTNITLGSSVTCRAARCFTSAGALSDGLFLFNPGFDGSIDTFFPFHTSLPGNSVDFPVTTVIQ